MKKYFFIIMIVLVSVSLAGLIATQILWLKKSIQLTENQYDDRVDRMLDDMLNEIRNFSDTAWPSEIFSSEQLVIFDVIDTSFLRNLLTKYIDYHRLDTLYRFALVRTSDDSIIYSINGYRKEFEKASSKACLSCIWKKEYIHFSVFFPDKHRSIYKQLAAWAILSFMFIIIVITTVFYIIYVVLRHKHISEIRNDFINNMTHEFKTPIATISIASEMLLKESVNPRAERIRKYSGIIFEENQRMKSQVDLVLQTALIERNQIVLTMKRIDLHSVIENTIESFVVEPDNKDAVFSADLSSTKNIIKGDPVHIRNIFGNVIENAVKYSGKEPKVTIKTFNSHGGITTVISDNGKGIPKEDQKRIFDKFYRVHSGDVHDVKGFGLGLYYVKTIIESHKGSIHVQSHLNKGSSFYVFLPSYNT